ncbi:MAG: amino acid adenylation domain-containing protein, partial [Gammaproteobacteria bacterium]|nr:amino acid adenylation domain-containing protein [Gammaproteobacteria bacterium]
LGAAPDAGDIDAGPELAIADRTQPLPLSFAQQRLWFLDELEPGTAVYNMPFALRTRGHIDRAALQNALDDLIARHESLRTQFVRIDDNPVQQVVDQLPVTIAWEDVADTTAQQTRASELARIGFSLETGPLLRLHVISATDDTHLLVLVIHHIVSDLWSMDVFFRELGELYGVHSGNGTAPAALPVQYGDYAVWQRKLLAGGAAETHLEFWREQLRDAPPVLELPLDFPRPPEPGFAGHWTARRLPASLVEPLETLAGESGATLFMLGFATFAMLLSRYANETDVVIGTPISGRQRTEFENLIGFFLNTLALRVDTDGSQSFSDFLQQVRKTALDAYDHQDLPFEKLVEELQPDRDMSHTPVFQHMFIWQDSRGSALQLPGLETEPATLVSHDTAKFDLTLAVTRDDEGIEIGAEYSTELFSAATVERLLDRYVALLQQVTSSPRQPLREFTLLAADERKRVVTEFNDTAISFGADLCVHELVEAQVARTPDTTAVCFGRAQLSYRELNARANALAAELRKRGAQPGINIAISCSRSPELAIAALAVLKSGACYVAVDPNFPAERISAMLADSGALLLLSRGDVAIASDSVPVMLLDQLELTPQTDNLPSLATPDDPLYCIYTSGSTGKPKGVQLTHRGLANLLQWQLQHERLRAPARTLQFASFSFDVSFQELFSTWSNGGTLVMIDEELRQDLTALAGFIAADRIERLYLPYAAFQPIAETLVSTGADCALQDIVVAGEQLQVSPEVRALFATLPAAALHNQYGPSETHVVTALTLSGDAAMWPALPSIGFPVANTRCYVLDERGEPLPVGIPGELYLAGAQVAIGYLGRPELNREKFTTDPFGADERMYRTGDRARWLADGQLEFLGRADDQIKWRGFRVEPGEIEAALTEIDSVQHAVVMLREDSPGMKRLVAYLTPAEGAAPDVPALKSSLQARLPDYMVPGVFVVLDAMPLTPSGKIARRRLPAPAAADLENRDYVAPRNDIETQICEIWTRVLDAGQVGVEDDFFALGGHSLLATKVIARVRDAYGANLPLKYLFRYPTPARLAAAIATLQKVRTEAPEVDDSDREEFRI